MTARRARRRRVLWATVMTGVAAVGVLGMLGLPGRRDVAQSVGVGVDAMDAVEVTTATVRTASGAITVEAAG